MKSNWFTRFVCALISVSVFACSGEDPIDLQEEAEFAQEEQAITGASSSGARSYGVSTGSTRNSCNATSTGQACLVPAANKTYTYKITDTGGASTCAWTSGQKTVIRGAMSSLASATGWTITEAAGSPNPGLNINCRNGVGNGPTSTALTAYRSWEPISSQVVTLTDTAAGTWQSFGEVLCKIDIADILARAATLPPSSGSGAASELLQHAAANCGLLSTGVGTRANAVTLSVADRTVHDNSAIMVVDEQSKCLAKSRVAGVSNQFTFAGACNL